MVICCIFAASAISAALLCLHALCLCSVLDTGTGAALRGLAPAGTEDDRLCYWLCGVGFDEIEWDGVE